MRRSPARQMKLESQHDAEYPALVGAALEAGRARGLDFSWAWRGALHAHPVPASWEPGLVKFLQDHMRAAFARDESARGRCRLSRTDTALLAGLHVPGSGRPALCRSGDGCQHPATVNGKWCDLHAAELARVRAMVTRVPVADAA